MKFIKKTTSYDLLMCVCRVTSFSLLGLTWFHISNDSIGAGIIAMMCSVFVYFITVTENNFHILLGMFFIVYVGTVVIV